jgi:putative hydrolase of the HAD superfamily
MIELLQQTRERAVVALLSDTNAFHWDFLALRYPALAAVPHRFLSFVEGMAKPDVAFYRHVEEHLRERMNNSTADNADGADGKKATTRRAGRESGLSILYFDDLPANIKAARSRGWDAVRFTQRRDAEDPLRRRGILS